MRQNATRALPRSSRIVGNRLACRLIAAALPAAASLGLAPAAHAQTTLLIDTAIPDNFDRGRNVSVRERPRPEYDALDLRTGSLIIAPQVDTGIGASSNVYLTGRNQVSDGYYYATPSLTVNTDTPGQQLTLSGAGTFRRYFNESARNQTTFDIRGLGEKDIGSYYGITGEAQYAKLYESPDTGALDPSLSVLSSYYRSYLSARGQYSRGRGRLVLAFDRTGLTFSDLIVGNGETSQSDRDRIIWRGSAQLQYAVSPSLSVYTQGSYDHIDYSRRLLNGAANRDSEGWRLVGGVNFDLAGLARGKIGLGYVNRNYDSPAFRDVDGFAGEMSIEYFPSLLWTVGLRASRTVEDANVSNTSAYFLDRVLVNVDHELLYNLIVGVTGSYNRQEYAFSSLRNNYYGAGFNARYLSAPGISLNMGIDYSRRTTSGSTQLPFDEYRGQIGVTFRR